MKLPHRRQFLHLAAAAAALPAPPDADTKTPPGWAPRAESRGNPRVPLRSEGSAWETHGARSFSLLPPPAFGEGSYRRLTRLGIAGRWRSILVLRVPTSTSTAMASKERTDRDRLRGWRDRKTQTWPTETRLRGWAHEIRTQKCRRKLSL
jgi:hypothetical protein